MISSLYRLISRKLPQVDSNSISSIQSVSSQFLPRGGQRSAVPLLATQGSVRDFSNSHRASLTRINRLQYLRQYPTLIVNPDGSTFTIRYHEPRQIIKLPVDINLLSDSARHARLERRKPKTKVKLEEEFDDEGFDAKKYLKIVRK